MPVAAIANARMLRTPFHVNGVILPAALGARLALVLSKPADKPCRLGVEGRDEAIPICAPTLSDLHGFASLAMTEYVESQRR
jgi:hypothetical protein